jgi:uncharacterized protein
MPFTIYEAAIPPMIRSLQNLSTILDKAVAQAKSEDKSLDTLLEARLAPDMFPFTRQIQVVSDTAKGAAARLAGVEPPSFPDEEKTFPSCSSALPRPSTT